MLKHVFLVCFGFMSFASAKVLSLVAVTDAACPVCQAWHEEVFPSYSIKSKIYDDLPKSMRVLDYSSSYDRQWISSHTKTAITGLPTFFLVEGETILTSFEGYSTLENFYKRLNKKVKEVGAQE